MTIRVATVEDAGAVAEIYAPYVKDSAISFEIEPPTPSEMAGRIARILETHPWLVLQEEGRVIGYAYAGAHAPRAAYRWSVDVTAYMRADARRKGHARALYTRLFEILVRQNFHAAYAGITLPNEPSVGFHEAMGFAPVGVYREVGFKMGAWRDVGWWGKTLGPAPATPAEPVPFAALDI